MEIEHIYSKKRADFEQLENVENLELLGNKSLLEKRIKIRATDYRFSNKRLYYLGKVKNKNSQPTFNLELQKLSRTCNDLERNNKILDSFMTYLEENNLFK